MRRKRENLIVAVDLGSASAKAIAASLNKNFQPRILAACQIPSAGLRRGVVTDLEECSLSIVNLLNELQGKINSPIKEIYLNFNGQDVNIHPSRGVTAVARADGEITQDDLLRALKNSQNINLPANRSVLHLIDLEYFVDGIGGIHDPKGMNGIRLEVESLVVSCFNPWRKNLIKCVQELAGYRVVEMVYSPLLSSLSTLSKNQKELGVLVLDLGGETTNLAVVQENKLLTLKTIPLGGEHITNDIALALRIPTKIAKEVKIHYGSASSKNISKKETVNLNEFDPSLEEEISRKYLAQIIEARLEEIFDLVNQEIKKIGKQANLPGGVVLVGGGAKLPSILEFSRDYLKMTSQIGFASNFSPESLWSEKEREILEDPLWVNASGLVLWAINSGIKSGSTPLIESETLTNKIKKFFKSFIP